MKKIAFIVLLFTLAQTNAQPPDAPLQPQEWVDSMGFGGWWIFNIPPKSDNKIRVLYSSKILDSLQTNFCFNGGRLHWNADEFYDANGDLLQSSIDFVEVIIDDMLARDMAISLNVQFQTSDEAKNNMSGVRSRMINAWKKLSITFKDKGHNLAMCPVIEFHGWENIDIPRSQQQDSLNVLYDDLTRVFREDNPTRIMSYKPWGAAKRGEAYTLTFPFGDDPLPSDAQQFYYVSSFSGSAGLGDWQNWTPTMPQAELDALHFQTMNAGDSRPEKFWGLRAMLDHRTNTGIPFWMDHWRPNYHKSAPEDQWTMEQNIAYSEFWIDKLAEVESAGAMFQTRTLWSDDADDLIRQTDSSSDDDIMSVLFMDMLSDRCNQSALGVENFNGDSRELEIYPNPTKNSVYVSMNEININQLKIYNYLAQEVTNKVFFNKISENKVSINCSALPQGIYILISKNNSAKFIKI